MKPDKYVQNGEWNSIGKRKISEKSNIQKRKKSNHHNPYITNKTCFNQSHEHEERNQSIVNDLYQLKEKKRVKRQEGKITVTLTPINTRPICSV